MATSDNVLSKLHDLLLYLIPQLSKFPRDQKFLLGDLIETRLFQGARPPAVVSRMSVLRRRTRRCVVSGQVNG